MANRFTLAFPGIRKLGRYLTRLMENHFKMTIFLYGVLLAALVGILKFFEYRYFIRELSLEIYVGVVATLFTALGIWIGLKLINRKKAVPINSEEIVIDRNIIRSLKISNREYEVLELIAKGLSNQEIADALFISLPTVKTHSSNLFVKLDVRRRTQAIQKAKDLNIIP
jgi:DNA-binding CsgD family transcriptional regulator